MGCSDRSDARVAGGEMLGDRKGVVAGVVIPED
jgi:hypothetical protein